MIAKSFACYLQLVNLFLFELISPKTLTFFLVSVLYSINILRSIASNDLSLHFTIFFPIYLFAILFCQGCLFFPLETFGFTLIFFCLKSQKIAKVLFDVEWEKVLDFFDIRERFVRVCFGAIGVLILKSKILLSANVFLLWFILNTRGRLGILAMIVFFIIGFHKPTSSLSISVLARKIQGKPFGQEFIFGFFVIFNSLELTIGEEIASSLLLVAFLLVESRIFIKSLIIEEIFPFLISVVYIFVLLVMLPKNNKSHPTVIDLCLVIYLILKLKSSEWKNLMNFSSHAEQVHFKIAARDSIVIPESKNQNLIKTPPNHFTSYKVQSRWILYIVLLQFSRSLVEIPLSLLIFNNFSKPKSKTLRSIPFVWFGLNLILVFSSKKVEVTRFLFEMMSKESFKVRSRLIFGLDGLDYAFLAMYLSIWAGFASRGLRQQAWIFNFFLIQIRIFASIFLSASLEITAVCFGLYVAMLLLSTDSPYIFSSS